MSLPEVLLWQRLRGERAGARYRRQHPIGVYTVDFYCAEARLVIEVDGDGHRAGDRPESDERREAFLIENGYRVVHFQVAMVLKDADAVAASIAALVESPLHHPAAPGGPPPRTGEDLR